MNIVDVAVYGVKVPFCEGRAGMITIAMAEGTNISVYFYKNFFILIIKIFQELLKDIEKRLVNNLATYAVPVFLRICNEFDKTGTFKLKKNELQKDGYDLKKCGENTIYYWNSKLKLYQKLNAEMQQKIDSGTYTRL